MRRDAVRSREKRFDIVRMHRRLHRIERPVKNIAIRMQVRFDALIHRRAIRVHLPDVRLALCVHPALLCFCGFCAFDACEGDARSKRAER